MIYVCLECLGESVDKFLMLLGVFGVNCAIHLFCARIDMQFIIMRLLWGLWKAFGWLLHRSPKFLYVMQSDRGCESDLTFLEFWHVFWCANCAMDTWKCLEYIGEASWQKLVQIGHFGVNCAIHPKVCILLQSFCQSLRCVRQPTYEICAWFGCDLTLIWSWWSPRWLTLPDLWSYCAYALVFVVFVVIQIFF